MFYRGWGCFRFNFKVYVLKCFLETFEKVANNILTLSNLKKKNPPFYHWSHQNYSWFQQYSFLIAKKVQLFHEKLIPLVLPWRNQKMLMYLNSFSCGCVIDSFADILQNYLKGVTCRVQINWSWVWLSVSKVLLVSKKILLEWKIDSISCMTQLDFYRLQKIKHIQCLAYEAAI